MAIGLGRMFGFHFLENFNYPYISKSITEFWRRWHISLSSFSGTMYIFRLAETENMYILMLQLYFAYGNMAWCSIYIHSVGNMAWHIQPYGKFIKSHSKSKEVTGRNFKRVIVSVFQHVYTMLVVMLGWVMFRSSGIKHAFNYIKSLFGLNNPEISVYNVWLYLNKWSFLILILGLIMCTPLLKKLYGLLKRKVNEKY